MQKINDIKIDIPRYPKLILDTLHNAGYEAYIVGGCVRDAILGKVASDFDITTNAKPLEVKKIFKRTIDTGIKHGTVSVLFYDAGIPKTFEVTTFRIDGEYDDARHPKEVKFVKDLREDLLRRDFTINAMAYSEEKGLVDEFGGLIDLDKKVIRAVGNPIERFTEDALRLLRAVRFAAKLGFDIEIDTKNAIPMLSKNLAYVSKERVQVELAKTITSENPDFVKLIFDLSLAPYICKDFEKVEIGKFEKNLKSNIAYACLFYNTDPKKAYDMLKELKLDNDTIKKVTYMLSGRTQYKKIEDYYSSKKLLEFSIAIKELINTLDYELTYDFIKLIEINEGKNDIIIKVKEKVLEFEANKEAIFISDLDIGGKDLIELDYKGEEIGVALAELLKIVYKIPTVNNKKALKEIAYKAYNIYKEASYGLY